MTGRGATRPGRDARRVTRYSRAHGKDEDAHECELADFAKRLLFMFLAFSLVLSL